MTTWQPPSSRPMSLHNIVLGVAIGLAILCAAITLVVVIERQRSEPALGTAISSLDAAQTELSRATDRLREATETLQSATRHLERAPTTINVMGLPPPTAPVLIDAPEPARYCLDPGRCTVPRAVVEALLADPARLAGQARVLPSIQDGVTRGFKLYGLRPGSLLRELGLKNGDMVTTANGLPLTSVQQTLTAYHELRRVDTLTLEIERKGQRLQKVITIE